MDAGWGAPVPHVRGLRRGGARAAPAGIAFIVTGCALILFALAGLALTAAPAHGQLLIDQGRLDRQEEPPAPLTPPPALRGATVAVETPAQPESAPLRVVRIEGSTAPQAQLEPIWTPFIGEILTPETVARIAGAVSEAYGDSGAAIYTVLAPAQDLSDGVLILDVIEGYIEQVALEGDVEDRDLSLVRAHAERLTAERPLLRATLERHLSLMRDIPGLTLDAQFQPGQTRGGVRLVLTLRQKRFDVSSALNTSGSSLLGRTQVTAQAEIYGLLAQGDHTAIGLTVPTNLRNFVFASLAHRRFIGSSGLALQLRASHLETRPQSLPLEGAATTAGAELSWPAIRAYRRNLSVSGGFDMLDSKNALFGTLFSTEHTRVLRGGASFSRSGDRSTSSAGATISQGLGALGAAVDPRAGAADFSKLTLRAGHNQALGSRAALRLAAAGQAAATSLPPSERFGLGGTAFGRAFESAALLGDHALAGSLELAFRPSLVPGLFEGSELYAFADAGRVWLRARPLSAARADSLASGGLGVRARIRRTSMVGLEFAHGLAAPDFLDDSQWRVLLSWNIRT